MKAQGIDVISFGAGEPDFDTPQPIVDAAHKALDAGFTKYTPTSGLKELKEAVADKLKRENKLDYAPEQIVISCGAKHSLFNSIWVTIEPGDEVIVIAPLWMTYIDQIQLAGGIPVILETRLEDRFVPSYEELKAKITAKTKAILINSPSNPTGAVYSRETLKEIAALAIRHNLWVISDEIYERLIYDEEQISIASLGKEIAEKTITINGCSKSYSMTGWRIGFGAYPGELAKLISNFQDQVTSNPNSIAQRGAIAALAMDPQIVADMRDEFKVRRDLICDELCNIPGIAIEKPRGAFYYFANVEKYLGGKMKTDLDLANHLLESAHVATIPGSVFEGPGHLRFSYAASQDDIRKGIGRIKKALEELGS